MADLITRAQAKEYLGIPSGVTTWDAVLDSLVARVSAKFEILCDRTIASATYTEYYSGDASRTLQLRQSPVTSITSIHSDFDRVTWDSTTLISADDYTFDGPSGVVYYDLSFIPGVKNVRVVYVAGYATTPAGIVDAVCEWVAAGFNRRKGSGLTSESFGGVSQSYLADAMPAGVREIVDRYTLRVSSQ